MNGFHVFNGKRALHLVQEDGPQVNKSKRNKKQDVEPRWQAGQILRRFKRGESIGELSYRESVKVHSIENVVRARLIELEGPAKVIEMPLPVERRKAA